MKFEDTEFQALLDTSTKQRRRIEAPRSSRSSTIVQAVVLAAVAIYFLVGGIAVLVA